MPLIIFMAVLALVGNISPQYSFENLRRLIRDVILIGLGFMMTIFTGLLGLESLATGAIDGMTMKTARRFIVDEKLYWFFRYFCSNYRHRHAIT